MIVIDFHSTGGDKVNYRDELKKIGIDWGLSYGELIFTSDEKNAWEYEIPWENVAEFMRLANVMTMPSVSESYSLVTQEAGMNKQVVVVNQDFPPFRDIFGHSIIERKYSSNIDIMNGLDGNTSTKYGPDGISEQERRAHEEKYHYETAGIIKSRLFDNGPMELAINLRKNRNLNAVFKKELEPLLFEL